MIILLKDKNIRLYFTCNLSQLSCLQVFNVVNALRCPQVHLVLGSHFLRCSKSSKFSPCPLSPLTYLVYLLLVCPRVHLMSSLRYLRCTKFSKLTLMCPPSPLTYQFTLIQTVKILNQQPLCVTHTFGLLDTPNSLSLLLSIFCLTSKFILLCYRTLSY